MENLSSNKIPDERIKAKSGRCRIPNSIIFEWQKLLGSINVQNSFLFTNWEKIRVVDAMFNRLDVLIINKYWMNVWEWIKWTRIWSLVTVCFKIPWSLKALRNKSFLLIYLPFVQIRKLSDSTKMSVSKACRWDVAKMQLLSTVYKF